MSGKAGRAGWLIGVALIAAVPVAAYFSTHTHVLTPVDGSIRESYTDLDLRLPIGLAVSGAGVLAAAALLRIKTRGEQ